MRCSVIALVLATILPAVARADPPDGSWSGTVTLESNFEHREEHPAQGEPSCSGRTRAWARYRATATLVPGTTSARATIRLSAGNEEVESCRGRVRCGGLTLGDLGRPRDFTRSSRQTLQSEVEQGAVASVSVEVDEASGAYTVRADFPAVAGGTQRFDSTERSSGTCVPEPPSEVHTVSLFEVEARSGEGTGTASRGRAERLSGTTRIDDDASFRWDLRREPPDCPELRRQASRERERAQQARTAALGLRAAVDAARLAAMAQLGAGGAASPQAAALGAAAVASLGQAAAALGPSASWQRLSSWFDEGGYAETLGTLDAAQAVAPSPAVAQLLALLQQLYEQRLQERLAQQMAEALDEAARQCRGRRPAR